MTRPRAGVGWLAAAALLVGATGCTGESSVVIAGEVVDAADREVAVPPRDADLHDAGWPETAAWIARETRDGRPVVVNVFASWCAPCRDEAPAFRAVSQDRPDVAFLGIDHQDLREKGRAFVEEEAIPFPTLYDVGGEVARAVGSTGMPTTAFFDLDGRLVDMHVGPLTEAELRTRLDELGFAAPGP